MPGKGDLVMRVPGLELRVESADLPLGQVLGADLQGAADPVQRVPGPAPVAQSVLLHPTTHLVHDLPAEFHHVEGVQDGDRLRELVADGIGVTVERIQRRRADPAREQ